ncbi:MAG: hypothetical protein MJ129_00165 [Clostridia bacterium]|nr:hypothetical protein [Clostridia bacterium]
MSKLYDKNRRPACDYCVHGKPAPDADAVLCSRKGIMSPSSSCSWYKYDPLKRKPKPKMIINTNYTPEDFEL